MGRTISVTAKTVFLVNAQATWRDRAGMALRRLAGRLDRCPPLAVYMSSSPRLTQAQVDEVFDFGFKQMNEALREMTRIAAVEQGMRDMSPGLFKKEVLVWPRPKP